jgi:hypothetical protein
MFQYFLQLKLFSFPELTCHTGLHIKFLAFLSDFQPVLNFLGLNIAFHKNPSSRSDVPSGWTDMMKLMYIRYLMYLTFAEELSTFLATLNTVISSGDAVLKQSAGEQLMLKKMKTAKQNLYLRNGSSKNSFFV